MLGQGNGWQTPINATQQQRLRAAGRVAGQAAATSASVGVAC